MCKAIDKYTGKELPMKLGFELYQLRSRLNVYWEFQTQKEREVISRYRYSITPDGGVKFDSGEDEKKFLAEYNAVCRELGDEEVDLGEFTKQTVHLLEGVNMAIEDIAALSEFADFVE